MNYTEERSPGGTVVSLRGSFTFQDHHSFRAMLDALNAAGGERKLLDLSQVEFIDSAALGMLLIAADEIDRKHGKLVLRNPSAPLAKLFELSAMDTLFTIERTGQAATSPSHQAPGAGSP